MLLRVELGLARMGSESDAERLSGVVALGLSLALSTTSAAAEVEPKWRHGKSSVGRDVNVACLKQDNCLVAGQNEVSTFLWHTYHGE